MRQKENGATCGKRKREREKNREPYGETKNRGWKIDRTRVARTPALENEGAKVSAIKLCLYKKLGRVVREEDG